MAIKFLFWMKNYHFLVNPQKKIFCSYTLNKDTFHKADLPSHSLPNYDTSKSKQMFSWIKCLT